MQINIQTLGVKGDGKTDDTLAIINAIKTAKLQKVDLYFPKGTYLIAGQGNNNGIIPLLDGVSLIGQGRYSTKILLSGGRYNPTSIFYQAWWDEPIINNISIVGLTLDGNLDKQTYKSVMGGQGDDYQYSHGLTMSNANSINVHHCRFMNFRGDGLIFGDAFQNKYPSPNLRLTTNINIFNNEFVNLYREGILFACTSVANVYNNYFHGNGYLVAGIDIERHHTTEQVNNINVHDNVFDFRDGLGPKERGGIPIRLRRAISMGFFYDSYSKNIVDGKASGHTIVNNIMYQGQIDCWGHTNVSIKDNYIEITKEVLTNVGFVVPYTLNIGDSNGQTIGLKDITISNNTIIGYPNNISTRYANVINS